MSRAAEVGDQGAQVGVELGGLVRGVSAVARGCRCCRRRPRVSVCSEGEARPLIVGEAEGEERQEGKGAPGTTRGDGDEEEESCGRYRVKAPSSSSPMPARTEGRRCRRAPAGFQYAPAAA